MAVWRRGEGVTMRDTCMEQYSCMVSCMVFLLYSTKWRTETHADSVPVGEDGVTAKVLGDTQHPWQHVLRLGHIQATRRCRGMRDRAVWQAVWNSAVFRCI